MDSYIPGNTILIVDDTAENIDILSTLLSAFNRKVATNGKRALELLGNGLHPGLILLDIDMPEMNGFEVCRILKANPVTSNIPVIFLTANTDKATTVEGFKLGACDFITKPFDPEELKIRIRTQLELAEARERLESMIRDMEVSSTLLKQAYEESNEQKRIISEERERSDKLLLNILPKSIADELKHKGHVEARKFRIATVLFADIVGFTKLSKGLSPNEIAHELNFLFVGYDLIMEKHGLEKIKTIGDGYMAAGGLPIPDGTNPANTVSAGLEMIRFTERTSSENEKVGKPAWSVRVGIHSGEVIAGVIGKNKYTYDIWGSTVNIASRMESGGQANKVNISGVTYQLVKDRFACERRANIEVKNMGKLDMYFVTGIL